MGNCDSFFPKKNKQTFFNTYLNRVSKFAFKAFAALCQLKENSLYLVRTTKLLQLITLLGTCIQKDEVYVPDLVLSIETCMRLGFSENSLLEGEKQMKEDYIGVFINSGTLEAISNRLSNLRTPLEATTPIPSLLINTLKLLETLTSYNDEKYVFIYQNFNFF